MIIKRDEQYVLKMFVTLFFVLFMEFVYAVGLKVSIGVFFAVNTPAFLFLFVFIVSYGRTFVLSQEGCTVCFLWFWKHYRWDEFKTKTIGHYPRFVLIPSGDCPYEEYAMFAPYRVRKPMYMRPMLYNLLHPWSYIYINFYVPEPKGKSFFGKATYNGRHYEIPKEEFIEKMRQWNVELA